MKDLFIPLKTEHFNDFKRGIKKFELRPYGPRWNEKTCFKGRGATLSHGYGKKDRLYGIVTDLYVCPVHQLPPCVKATWYKIYGDKYEQVATISIKLDTPQDARA